MDPDKEIENLRNEINQERHMREMLEQSATDLAKTVGDLKEKLNQAEDEEDEWRNRYEAQLDTNSQLETQISLVQEKMGQLKTELLNSGKLDGNALDIDSLTDADVRKLMRKFEREKIDLEGQLKDLEWRLDTESQDFHKIKEEKKQHAAALIEAEAIIVDRKMRQQSLKEQRTEVIGQPKMHKKRVYGIPDNQRVLDPRKGPVKKTAAVKRLPKLNHTPPNSDISSSDIVSQEGSQRRSVPLTSPHTSGKKDSPRLADSVTPPGSNTKASYDLPLN